MVKKASLLPKFVLPFLYAFNYVDTKRCLTTAKRKERTGFEGGTGTGAALKQFRCSQERFQCNLVDSRKVQTRRVKSYLRSCKIKGLHGAPSSDSFFKHPIELIQPVAVTPRHVLQLFGKSCCKSATK